MNKILVIGLSGESAFLRVKSFPKKGETIQAQNVYLEPGGKGFNQSVTINRLGHKVTFLTMLGNDDMGKRCLAFLKKEKIKVVPLISNKPTAYACIITTETGDNEVIVSTSATDELSPKDLMNHEELFKEAKFVLLQQEIKEETLMAALNLCHKYHIFTILDPSPIKKPINWEIINKANIITPNEGEAANLFGVNFSNDLFEVAKIIQSKITNIVIVTMGAKGAMIIDKANIKLIPAPIVDCIDTTGAGDIFNGALVSKLAEGKSIETSVAFAIKMASFSTTISYVMPSIIVTK